MAVTIPRGVFGVASFQPETRLFVALFMQIMEKLWISGPRKFTAKTNPPVTNTTQTDTTPTDSVPTDTTSPY